jgi:hypothetical protein
MLETEPASRSAWVIVYEAVQIAWAPGESVESGQLSSEVRGSLIDSPVRVRLPVLVTVME